MSNVCPNNDTKNTLLILVIKFQRSISQPADIEHKYISVQNDAINKVFKRIQPKLCWTFITRSMKQKPTLLTRCIFAAAPFSLTGVRGGSFKVQQNIFKRLIYSRGKLNPSYWSLGRHAFCSLDNTSLVCQQTLKSFCLEHRAGFLLQLFVLFLLTISR